MWSVWPGSLPACPQAIHARPVRRIDPLGPGKQVAGVRKIFFLVWLAGLAPWGRAVPPSDFFEPDLAMYSFADFWVVRPLTAAVLPLTMTTFAVSAPATAGSGKESVQRSYDILVGDPAEFLVARPLGSFFDWENRDKTKPVVIQFPDGYTVAELSPQQERRYRVALREHQSRILAIERETQLPEEDRKSLAAAEERRWENVLRLLLSL